MPLRVVDAYLAEPSEPDEDAEWLADVVEYARDRWGPAIAARLRAVQPAPNDDFQVSVEALDRAMKPHKFELE